MAYDLEVAVRGGPEACADRPQIVPEAHQQAKATAEPLSAQRPPEKTLRELLVIFLNDPVKARGDKVRMIAVFKVHLVARAKIYARKREDGDLWKICEGKEVFRTVIPQLGLVDEDAGERAITAVWERRPDLIPNELAGLRAYIQSL